MKRELSRTFIRYLPTTAAIVGMILALGSIVFFFESDFRRIIGVSGGILFLLGAVWYAANPFFKNKRKYLALRADSQCEWRVRRVPTSRWRPNSLR